MSVVENETDVRIHHLIVGSTILRLKPLCLQENNIARSNPKHALHAFAQSILEHFFVHLVLADFWATFIKLNQIQIHPYLFVGIVVIVLLFLCYQIVPMLSISHVIWTNLSSLVMCRLYTGIGDAI
jgi:hypothetical protein